MRRSPFETLLQVREVREHQARAAAADAHRLWVDASVAVRDGEETLRRMRLPDRGSRSQFLAAVAAQRAQADQVVWLRQQAAQRAEGMRGAQAEWTRTEQDRGAADRMLQRDRTRAAAERLRREQRELDEIGTSRWRPPADGALPPVPVVAPPARPVPALAAVGGGTWPPAPSGGDLA